MLYDLGIDIRVSILTINKTDSKNILAFAMSAKNANAINRYLCSNSGKAVFVI